MAAGLIATVGAAPAPVDFFSHHGQRSRHEAGLRPCNGRGLDPQAATCLAALTPKRAPRVLELGPGAGIAAAAIRRLLPHCVLESISLTPIDPCFWPDPDQPAAPPLQGTAHDTPFIDRQHVGEAEACLDALLGEFDFIYDSFGPLFWQLTEAERAGDRAGAERLVAAVLRRLAPGGHLFVAASDGALWLEGLLDRLAGPHDGLVLYPPRFAATQIRTCVFEKSS